MLDLLVILFYFLMKKGNLKQSLSELSFHATVAFKLNMCKKEKKENGNLGSLTTVLLEQSASKCCIKIKDRGAVEYKSYKDKYGCIHTRREAGQK